MLIVASLLEDGVGVFTCFGELYAAEAVTAIVFAQRQARAGGQRCAIVGCERELELFILAVAVPGGKRLAHGEAGKRGTVRCGRGVGVLKREAASGCIVVLISVNGDGNALDLELVRAVLQAGSYGHGVDRAVIGNVLIVASLLADGVGVFTGFGELYVAEAVAAIVLAQRQARAGGQRCAIAARERELELFILAVAVPGGKRLAHGEAGERGAVGCRPGNIAVHEADFIRFSGRLDTSGLGAFHRAADECLPAAAVEDGVLTDSPLGADGDIRQRHALAMLEGQERFAIGKGERSAAVFRRIGDLACKGRFAVSLGKSYSEVKFHVELAVGKLVGSLRGLNGLFNAQRSDRLVLDSDNHFSGKEPRYVRIAQIALIEGYHGTGHLGGKVLLNAVPDPSGVSHPAGALIIRVSRHILYALTGIGLSARIHGELYRLAAVDSVNGELELALGVELAPEAR